MRSSRNPAHILPGLCLSIAVAALAQAGEWLQAALFGQVLADSLVLAIVAGTAIHSVLGLGGGFAPGIRFASKTVLEVAIVLLGGTISAGAILQTGPLLFAVVVLVVVAALALSYTIARALGLGDRLATLVACGNSICGNSAIMATAPVIGAPAEDVAASIAFTAALGVVVVLLLPLGFSLLGVSQWQYGVIAGLSVYAVPQVLAATVPVGITSTQIGTIVKLMRVLMLGPVVLALGLLRGRRAGAALPVAMLVPWFIVGFLLMLTARTLGVLPAPMLPALQTASADLTLLSMAALGLSVDLRSVAASGGRVLAAGFLSIVVLVALATATAFLLSNA